LQTLTSYYTALGQRQHIEPLTLQQHHDHFTLYAPVGGCHARGDGCGGCKRGPVWSSPHPEKSVRSPQCRRYLIAGWIITAAQTEVEVGVEVDPERTENRVMGCRRTLRLSGGMEVKGGQLGVHWSQMIVSAGTV